MGGIFQMEWDVMLLRYINSRWCHPVFDHIMPLMRNANTWIPLYVFLMVFAVYRYGKSGWWWLLAAASTPVITDVLSSWVVKELIHRLRPCNDPLIRIWLRTLPGIQFPQSSSFTSSHAANHFGLAVFLFLTLRNSLPGWRWMFFFWALVIGYAQVYVGVHYPLDILAGAALGSAVGYSTALLFHRRFELR